jgi:hypothetical protein
MATLAEIRAKLKAAETRTTDSNTGGDKAIYPFWTIKNGGEAVFRFLPDGNQKNTLFWVERSVIKLPFAGIKGRNDNKPIVVNVPCVEMYDDGSVCPILSEVRNWFKDPSLEDMGRKYWKKKSYIFQGFVVEDGLDEKEKPENPIRRFVIGPQIYKIIHAAILDPEFGEDSPTDYVNGIDFRLKVGTKGGYADYSTSVWSRRTRPLSSDETAALEQYQLPNLADHLPKKPGEVELKVMMEMFEASVNGEAYDIERWGKYFRPYGISESPTVSAPTPTPTVSVQPVVHTTETVQVSENEAMPWDEPAEIVAFTPPTAVETTTSSDSRANDILARIRNRG